MRTLPSQFQNALPILIVALALLPGKTTFAQETPAVAGADKVQQDQSRPDQPKQGPPKPDQSTQDDAKDERPLPDIATLMQQVQANLKNENAARKDYIFHTVETEQDFDGGGAVKKTVVTESDTFWVNGVPVSKITKKNGRELTPDEKKKEDEKIDKEVAKARERKEKAEAKGKETSPRGDELVTAARILELGTLSNPRRLQLDGRDTIAVDYAGNPKAKTRNSAEQVFRDLVGTVWIDEQDHVLRKVEGHFLNAFKIAGGLVVNVKKDTNFSFEAHKINGEVWLPARVEAQGAFHYLLFGGFNGKFEAQMSDYRKFKATATILPGLNKVEDGTKTPDQQ